MIMMERLSVGHQELARQFVMFTFSGVRIVLGANKRENLLLSLGGGICRNLFRPSKRMKWRFFEGKLNKQRFWSANMEIKRAVSGIGCASGGLTRDESEVE